MVSNNIPDYLVWLVWTFLSRVPKKANTSIPDLNSEDLVEELMSDAQVTFSDGLLEAIQSPTPPPTSFFTSLPSDPGKEWGVYALVLSKIGHRDKIYIGSGTHLGIGVTYRWNQYDRPENLPTLVKKAVLDGYHILHKGLLCQAPIPYHSRMLSIRYLHLILETIFTIRFWALDSKSDVYEVPIHCPWRLDDLPYDGCCTHLAHQESLREGNMCGLADDEIEEYLAEEKQRKPVNSAVRNRRLTQSAHKGKRQMRREASLRSLRRTPKAELAERRRAQRTKALASGRFSCDPCGYNAPSVDKLNKHLATQKHQNKVNNAVPIPTTSDAIRRADAIALRKFYCGICKKAFGTGHFLNNHLVTEAHRKKAAIHEPQPAPAIDKETELEAAQSEPGPSVSEEVLAASRAAREAQRAAKQAKIKTNLAEQRWHCTPCNRSFGLEGYLKAHEKSQSHKNAMEAAES